MRILWVKVGGLWPLNTGGRLRSFNIVSELSRSHRVTLLTTHSPEEDPKTLVAQLPQCERVISVPCDVPKQGSVRFGLALVRSWLSHYPVDLWKWRVPALLHEVRRHLASRGFDLCVADFLTAIPNVPLAGPIPIILFEHNAEHVIWTRLSQLETRALYRPLLALESKKMRRFETQACARVSLTIAVSEADREVLAADAPGAKVRSISTGVDVSYFTPNGAHELPAGLVFTGAMDWYPNEDAMLYLVEAILPLIRREVAQASLVVVGRNPSPRLRTAAAGAGVHVTGTVDDVRPYVADAAVYVVPLRIGGGTRLKIFEALAMGKAVVSTMVGAEGLPLIPGEHFIQADGPADFAKAVVSLLRNPVRRRELGVAGRRLVEERYSWPSVAREFEARCREVANHAR